MKLKRAGFVPAMVLVCLILGLGAPTVFGQQSPEQAAKVMVDASYLMLAEASPTQNGFAAGQQNSPTDNKPSANNASDSGQAGAPSTQKSKKAKPTKIPGNKGDRVHYDVNGNPIPNPNATPLNYGRQPARIMGWIPNFRAVSVGAKPPPPTFKEKFLIGTQNSFDYSAFIFEASDAGVSYAEGLYPEFGTGWIAYGRYYWHGFVDKAIGNYMTDTIVPTLTRQDSRYYALGRGRWYKRALYAYSRIAITPNDHGRNTFNYSEIIGKGAAAGLGDLYYPRKYRTMGYTGYRWAWQVGVLDGGYNVFREFWPDIAKHVLHLNAKYQ